MPKQRIAVFAIVAGLMLPAVASCFVPVKAQAQMQECCAQLACARGHQEQTCYATPLSASTSQMSPEARTSLAAPLSAVFAAHLETPDAAAMFGLAAAVETPQHSPPALYTLHLALLI